MTDSTPTIPEMCEQIAGALDPEFKRLDWWEPRATPIGVPWIYTGPTDPAEAKAAFEPLVREMEPLQADFTDELYFAWNAKEEYIANFALWILFKMTPKQYITALWRATR